MPIAEFSFKMNLDRDLPPASTRGEFAPPSKKIAKKKMSSRASKLRLGGNSAEIKSYLTKLQDLVPFVPKDRKCSKLEVIQGVIDYICHLQGALATHPAVVGSGSTTVPVVPECKVPYCQQRQELRAALMEAENEEPQDAEVPEVIVNSKYAPQSHSLVYPFVFKSFTSVH
jgi:hypothetical protein